MLARLEKMMTHFLDLEKQLSEPEIMKDMNKYKEISQEHAHLKQLSDLYLNHKTTLSQLEDAKSIVQDETDADMLEMAKEELKELEIEKQAQISKIKVLLVPRDPMDKKNIIMEIRAGTGGDESALFSADLFRMYSRFAEEHKWKIEVLSSNEIGLGGFKEIVFSISGTSVFEFLKFESGVHRVQRVPATESSGRIHTSAVTVAVLPEAEETDIVIKTQDLKVDVFRASGPGGQSVNTTDSAVRLTHLPTGVVVICQDEKSQIKNKAKAMKVLRARIYEAEAKKKADERAESRKSQVGSGDRSERIRTYNFPQNRLTDHRINLTLYKLDQVMQGSLTQVIEPLKLSNSEDLLANSL